MYTVQSLILKFNWSALLGCLGLCLEQSRIGSPYWKGRSQIKKGIFRALMEVEVSLNKP